MAKQRDVAGTYNLLMDSASSRWFALNIDAAPDQHVFTHLVFEGPSSRVGVSLVEYHPSDQGFARARVSDR